MALLAATNAVTLGYAACMCCQVAPVIITTGFPSGRPS
jgi:hypothetical protein